LTPLSGTVVSGSNNTFVVDCSDGSIRRCSIKGKVMKSLKGYYNSLAPGDVVSVDPDSLHAEQGSLLGMEARRNFFWRWNEKGKSVQAIAANLDLVVCVASPRFPPFRPRFVDRVAITAELENLPLVIIVNKSDLGLDEETVERVEDYRRIGYEVRLCSAKTGEGLDGLRERIQGKTAAFVGQSGAGKSSILNALQPGLGFRVGEVSEKYERGKHTTTCSVLTVLEDGVTRIIDTPGFRRLAIRGIPQDSLVACFPEMRGLAEQCDYGLACHHLDEPGCRVTAGVEEGIVHPDRYESYLRVRSELEETLAYAKKAGRPRRDYSDDDE
jgi:ribosome biogenesis GTPase / thiamine phosphate phosphatase